MCIIIIYIAAVIVLISAFVTIITAVHTMCIIFHLLFYLRNFQAQNNAASRNMDAAKRSNYTSIGFTIASIIFAILPIIIIVIIVVIDGGVTTTTIRGSNRLL